MHMADALLSPAVGGAMWVATAATVTYGSAAVRREMDDRRIPLMGVLGAFIFAAQMINFTIPLTGSSGHLGGGMILAILLGPAPGFLVMASVLAVQALFFADGGLLALGANIFNLGFFPCFVAYPLLYRTVAAGNPSPGRRAGAAVTAAVVGLQLGAFAVVAETALSGRSELPFAPFLLLMQSIHLAIGLVEGFVTAAVVSFVLAAQPDILSRGKNGAGSSMKKVLAGFAVAALLAGGVLSWFASSRPDGLEWAVSRITGSGEVAAPSGEVHGLLGEVREKTALLPDYAPPPAGGEKSSPVPGTAANAGTAAAGIVGGLITLAAAAGIGVILRRRKQPA
jgi:cobalt/nickel transport system permease protein